MEDMADQLFAGILDDLFEDNLPEAEGGHLELFVPNFFSGGPLLPPPTPWPSSGPEDPSRQFIHHHHPLHQQHHLPPPPYNQRLPPLASPHSSRAYPRNISANSPPSLSSSHAAASSFGTAQSPLPNPPSRPCDSRIPTPLPSLLHHPPRDQPPLADLDSRGGQTLPSISQNIPIVSPTQQNRSYSRQGNGDTPVSRSWEFSRPAADINDPFIEALATGTFSSPTAAREDDENLLAALVSAGAFSSPSTAPFGQQPCATSSPPAEEETLPESSGHSSSNHTSSAATDMPVARERRRRTDATANSPTGGSASKRRRSQELVETPESQKTKRPRSTAAKIELDLDDNLFHDDPEDKDVINLADPDENTKVEPEPEPEVDNSVKLSAFQCVICMDSVTDLTVTYCGHLFCAECLHSSLHIDSTKRICPICRQKIDHVPSSGRFTTKSKGYWALELKLMTAKRSGKLPAR